MTSYGNARHEVAYNDARSGVGGFNSDGNVVVISHNCWRLRRSRIALAAAGAHAAPSAGLDSAANILLFHAVAILGGTALLLQSMLSRQLALIALAAWALGTILFSADVALRAFVGQRLFPMAAPTGGIILILAWLFWQLPHLLKHLITPRKISLSAHIPSGFGTSAVDLAGFRC